MSVCHAGFGWAMMLIGFGACGMTMRRARKKSGGQLKAV
jgi:hypothetical protein